MAGLGLQADRLFGQAQTFGADGVEQFGIFVGIDNIDAPNTATVPASIAA